MDTQHQSCFMAPQNIRRTSIYCTCVPITYAIIIHDNVHAALFLPLVTPRHNYVRPSQRISGFYVRGSTLSFIFVFCFYHDLAAHWYALAHFVARRLFRPITQLPMMSTIRAGWPGKVGSTHFTPPPVQSAFVISRVNGSTLHCFCNTRVFDFVRFLVGWVCPEILV